MSIALGMTVANIALFTILGLYFDQVIPNEFGNKRHWLLCLHRSKKQNSRLSNKMVEQEAEEEQIDYRSELSEKTHKKMRSTGGRVEEVDAQFRE